MYLRLLIFTSALSILFFTSCSYQKINDEIPKSQKSEEIDSFLQSYFNENVFNGNVIVRIGENELYKRSFGYTDGSRSQNLSDSSVFSIGSISKEFQVVSIMKLVDDGVLSYDTKLSDIMSELPNWSDSILLSHLLNNVSGLPQLNFKAVKSKDDLHRDLINTKELINVPGAEYLYNHNIPILLIEIIERKSGITFQEYVRENILTNLEMNETVFDPTSEYSNLAFSYNASFKNDKTYNPFDGWVYTTSSDLMKWNIAIHDGSLVSERSYNRLMRNEYFPELMAGLGIPDSSGLGHTIHHWGGYFNYISLTYVNLDKDLHIVMLSNNGCRELLNMAEHIDRVIN